MPKQAPVIEYTSEPATTVYKTSNARPALRSGPPLPAVPANDASLSAMPVAQPESDNFWPALWIAIVLGILIFGGMK